MDAMNEINQQVIVKKLTSSLIPDPNQPRKTFNPADIEEVSRSIKSEGIIIPIEVDKNNTIVTGERRWKAAKLAGLQLVPVVTIDPGDQNDRFLRQVSSNIFGNTMTVYDTAAAVKRVVDLGLASRLGKSESWITKQLEIFMESDIKKVFY